jgi:predicted metal-dependent phosphoesterase TrpH
MSLGTLSADATHRKHSIDLHVHTTESDGTLTPAEVILAARRAGLKAIGITDHDTFGGHDSAIALAGTLKLDLICGIELSAKFEKHSVHILGYFLNGNPCGQIREWVAKLQEKRHARNEQLVGLL